MPSGIYRPLHETLKGDIDDSYEYTTTATTNGTERRVSIGHPKRHWQLRKGSSKKLTLLVMVSVMLLFVYIGWSMIVSTKLALPHFAAATTAQKHSHLSTKAAADELVQKMLSKAKYKTINESVVICSQVFNDSRLYIRNKAQSDYSHLPVIYFITPTYPRREQIAELTRLAHTLMHVPRIHWIVADDRQHCNAYLGRVLKQFEIPFSLLCSPMPDEFRKDHYVPRGVSNRRAALQWLRNHNITSGVLYFGDDDNTYDLRLFEEMRDTKRVSMFPVGLVTLYSVSGPVVRKGKVVGFLDSWVAKRHWPVDMAGFAVNVGYLSEHPNLTMPYKAGYEEDIFLRSIALRMDMIEPKANNCTEVLVWHTQTRNNVASTALKIKSEYLDERSSLGKLMATLTDMGIAHPSDTEGIDAGLSKNGKVRSYDYFFS